MGNTNDKLQLYRRRFIPDELIYLKDDKILNADSDRIVTKWNVLTPRHDFTHGVSCYFINDGFKISKFLNDNNELIYWYCDIIDTDIDGNKYTFNDLLVDVIIYDNGFVKVVDLDEIAIALKNKIINVDIAIKAMERIDKLLNIIYNGDFKRYTAYIDEVD